MKIPSDILNAILNANIGTYIDILEREYITLTPGKLGNLYEIEDFSDRSSVATNYQRYLASIKMEFNGFIFNKSRGTIKPNFILSGIRFKLKI